MYRTPLLIASSLLLIVPKLMLVAYLNAALWADFGVWDVCLIVAQDLLFATIVFCLLFWTMKNPTRMRVAACFLITSITLLVLFIDARVRQLWLKPLDFSLIGYYWSNAGDLTSGISAFLKYNAGFGVTFRKWLFFALSIHACLWVATAWVLGRKANRTKSIAGIPRDLRLTLGGGAMAMAAFIIMALIGSALPLLRGKKHIGWFSHPVQGKRT
ncbi:MAG: hypothetical protein IPK83_03530 [Planctomycetes bacterium]|nr:hypothetical protein [Planctomycetota bacterium]